jgi:ketosteroid isomerase-like protein
MSQENVEVVRRVVDAFNRGDLDVVLRESDPDVLVDWSRSRGVEAGVYRGHREVRAFWSTFFDTFDRVLVSAEEFIDRGEHVAVPNRTCVWGREGVVAEAHNVSVGTLRDGLIVSWRLFQSWAEAVEALESSE